MSIANWNAITQYLPGDEVLYQSFAYYALLANRNVLPNTLAPNWALVLLPPFNPSYAEFINTASVPLPAGVQTPIPYSNKNHGTPDITFAGTQITTATTGVYRVIFSAQLDKGGGGGTDEIQMWFRVNGVDIPNSNSKEDLSQQINLVMTIETQLSLTAGQPLEIVGYSVPTAVQCQLLGQPIDATHPVAIPSIIVDIQRIS